MLLAPDRKKIATIIVGSMKPDYVQKMGEKSDAKPMEMGEGEASEELEPKAVAAKAVLKAIDAKDPKKLAMAMSELIAMCSGSEEYYGKESEESEKDSAEY